MNAQESGSVFSTGQKYALTEIVSAYGLELNELVFDLNIGHVQIQSDLIIFTKLSLSL